MIDARISEASKRAYAHARSRLRMTPRMARSYSTDARYQAEIEHGVCSRCHSAPATHGRRCEPCALRDLEMVR